MCQPAQKVKGLFRFTVADIRGSIFYQTLVRNEEPKGVFVSKEPIQVNEGIVSSIQ